MYDTPGLGDIKGEEEEKLHLETVEDFIAKKKIHLVVYCFQMKETVMTSSIVGALRKYHQVGVDWEQSVTALTFADALYMPKSKQGHPDLNMSHYFNERLTILQRQLRKELVIVDVKSDVVESLKICPTSLLPTDQLPIDGIHHSGCTLWRSCHLRQLFGSWKCTGTTSVPSKHPFRGSVSNFKCSSAGKTKISLLKTLLSQ